MAGNPGVDISKEQSTDMSSNLPCALNVLGVNVHPFCGYAEAVRCISQRLRARQKTFVVAINPEKIQKARHEPRLRKVLGGAEIGLCDGIGTVLAVRLLHKRRIPRITGIQLFFELAQAAAEKKWRIFLLGASPESSVIAVEKLMERFPDLVIAGRQDGYFQDSAAVVKTVNASDADLLFVAMGSPRQELWITEHRDELATPFCMGIGGTMDVLSGQAKWAPRLFRRTGTEFIYRLVCEPRRWRRQIVLPVFFWNVLREWGRKIIGRWQANDSE